jgi:hypothetical protein
MAVIKKNGLQDLTRINTVVVVRAAQVGDSRKTPTSLPAPDERDSQPLFIPWS